MTSSVSVPAAGKKWAHLDSKAGYEAQQACGQVHCGVGVAAQHALDGVAQVLRALCCPGLQHHKSLSKKRWRLTTEHKLQAASNTTPRMAKAELP